MNARNPVLRLSLWTSANDGTKVYRQPLVSCTLATTGAPTSVITTPA